MSLLTIKKVPDPILKQPCVDIDAFGDRLKNLANDMFDTMYHNKGVGLAGPQVGVLEKILVLGFKGQEMILINPEIISFEGEEVAEEGCLSIPDILIPVERAKTIEVKAQDVDGELLEFTASDFVARIIQHETDHLHGILITDKPFQGVM